MTYIKVLWNHQFEDEPIELFSELDTHRHELRKIERFRNGFLSFASSHETSGNTHLSDTPLSSLHEIARDPQFSPSIIDKNEFEQHWQKALIATAA